MQAFASALVDRLEDARLARAADPTTSPAPAGQALTGAPLKQLGDTRLAYTADPVATLMPPEGFGRGGSERSRMMPAAAAPALPGMQAPPEDFALGGSRRPGSAPAPGLEAADVQELLEDVLADAGEAARTGPGPGSAARAADAEDSVRGLGLVVSGAHVCWVQAERPTEIRTCMCRRTCAYCVYHALLCIESRTRPC